MDITSVRELFPHIKYGLIYLNHASTGPMSAKVLETINKLLKEKSETKIDDYKSFLKVQDETKQILGKYINAKPDRLAFVDNTSTGINILASGIKWQKGDHILLNDIEFPANVYPFINLKKFGVDVEFVKSENGIVSADDIIRKVNERTKLISVSFVQFISGYRIDLEKLGKFCKTNEIILSVDAIQGIGALNLDVEKMNIDFISCGTQKWLMGLQGLGFIFVRDSLQQKLEPANIGWLSVENAWHLLDFDMKLKQSANVFQGGTLNTLGIYAFNASLKLLQEFGFGKIENSVISNTIYLHKKLNELGIKPLLNGLESGFLSGITSFKLDEGEELINYLENKKIVCSFREGYLRLAPHFYNTQNEIDYLIEAIKRF